MKSRLDWKGVGQFISVCVKASTIIKDAFKEIGVGIEIIDWLIAAGKQEFSSALKELGKSYKKSLRADPAVIVLPSGARIHTVHVRVKLDRPWQEAVNAAGPDTLDNYNVRKIGDLYPVTGTEEVEEDLVLLNYPQGDGNWDKALAWARTQGLENTVPRETFAIGEQYPKLNEQLRINPMYVVATTECYFEGCRHACSVWWPSSNRQVHLLWISNLSGQGGWFVFRKSVLKTKAL